VIVKYGVGKYGNAAADGRRMAREPGWAVMKRPSFLMRARYGTSFGSVPAHERSVKRRDSGGGEMHGLAGPCRRRCQGGSTVIIKIRIDVDAGDG
jgi:hypothetical protein